MTGDQYRLDIMQNVTQVTDDPRWGSLFISLTLKMFRLYIIDSIWQYNSSQKGYVSYKWDKSQKSEI